MSGSLGFSKSKSRSGSEQSTFVDPNQQAFLDFARSQASNLATQQGQQIGGLFGQAAGLQETGQEFLGGIQQTQGQLGGAFSGGFGQGQVGIDALSQQAQGLDIGGQALTQQALGQNPNLQAQIGQLGSDINRQFQQQLTGISTQAIGGGQLGGGRQGVAQGLLGQSALDAFSRGATQLRGDDIGRQLQAAQALGGLQGGAAQGLAGLGGQQALGAAGLNQAGQLGAGQLGLGGLQSLQGQFNLGFSPFEAQFTPLQNLAQIIGGPTVLGQGTSFGKTDQFGLQTSGGVGGGGFF